MNKNNCKKTWREVKRHRELYLLFLPVAIFFLIFCYYPMYGMTLAFKEYYIKRGILGSPWIGFDHFEELFSTVQFLSVFRNTIVISLLKILFCFPAPILIALMMNEMHFRKYRTVLQTLMYLPHFISWVIMAKLVKDLLSIDGGLINEIIAAFGGTPKSFTLDPGAFYPILICSEILKEAGWGTIIYIAALAGVPAELNEAAEVDGCGRFRRIIHITLPCIGMTITIMFIMTLGNVMNAGFDPIFNLYNSAVYSTADIIDTYVYRIGLTQGLFEKATAVGLFKSLINFVLLLGSNFTVKKMTGAGIYE